MLFEEILLPQIVVEYLTIFVAYVRELQPVCMGHRHIPLKEIGVDVIDFAAMHLHIEL